MAPARKVIHTTRPAGTAWRNAMICNPKTERVAKDAITTLK
jgi:hypothetical protein